MADPHRPPFSSYLDRDVARETRKTKRNRTLVLSIGIHAVAFFILFLYSVLHVDELFGPSVEVKMFAPRAAPPGAVDHLKMPLP